MAEQQNGGTLGRSPEDVAAELAAQFPGLTEARVVHYVLPDGQHRPALVVRVWRQDHLPGKPPTGLVQVQVFLDGTNDLATVADLVGPEAAPQNCVRGMMWVTSVHHDPEGRIRGTWHWPERA